MISGVCPMSRADPVLHYEAEGYFAEEE